MINWKEISELHVIQKLEQIIGKWFGVELFYTNEHYKLQGKILDKSYEFHNHFLKVQMQMNYGYEYLGQDIEKISDLAVEMKDKKSLIFDSFFDYVKGVGSQIDSDGEFSGMVFAYPFVSDKTTKEEMQNIESKMVECGASPEDAKVSVENLQKMSEQEKEYLQELVELVAQEIVTFHHEIGKREERILELNSELGQKYRYHSMIGKSKKIQQVYSLLDKIASSESTVLIQGENGTGKELVAKAVHYTSPRKDCVFLAQNCSAFNDNLLDSELFGHVKGAFTGAVKDKKGLFEMANGGTLFLDEIGDTSLTMQVKLLRVLQEGTFMPVGATTPRKVNVRIIAATNRKLKEMISKGEFREDLYYRINVINVNLPPLRERKDDISLLIDHFLEQRCAEMGLPTKVISKKTMEKLLDYPWPGNVRELENEIERLVVLASDEKTITPDMLSSRITDFGQGGGAPHGIRTSGNLKEALEELEKIMIKEGLKRCNFNKSKLAKELGISRAGLIMKVDKYGLDKRKRAAGE